MAARTRRDDWIFMLVQCSMKVLWCSDGKSSLGVVLDSVCCLCLRGGCRSALLHPLRPEGGQIWPKDTQAESS